jgi:O-antigen/teichoic acid export membrane protein
MISFLDKSDEAGFFSIANRIVGIGIIAISAVMKSSYPRLLKTMKERTFKFIDLGYYPLIYFFLIFLGSSVLYITFDLVVLDFIGNEYSPSLAVLRILIFYVLIQSFISPLLLFLQAHDLEQKIFYCTFPLPFIKIILNFYFFPTYGTIGMAYSTLILYTFFLLFLIAINFNLFRKYF